MTDEERQALAAWIERACEFLIALAAEKFPGVAMDGDGGLIDRTRGLCAQLRLGPDVVTIEPPMMPEDRRP